MVLSFISLFFKLFHKIGKGGWVLILVYEFSIIRILKVEMFIIEEKMVG